MTLDKNLSNIDFRDPTEKEAMDKTYNVQLVIVEVRVNIILYVYSDEE